MAAIVPLRHQEPYPREEGDENDVKRGDQRQDGAERLLARLVAQHALRRDRAETAAHERQHQQGALPYAPFAGDRRLLVPPVDAEHDEVEKQVDQNGCGEVFGLHIRSLAPCG